MRTRSVKTDEMDCILMALRKENRLACELMLRTGLRVSDVLKIKTNDLDKQRFSVKEMKTGKSRRITLSPEIRQELAGVAGRVFVFGHRLNQYKHRTRQAVYLDIKRAAKALRLKGTVAPHSVRKTYAVEKYNACGDMKRVQELLNHESIETTMLYVLADELKARNGRNVSKRKKTPEKSTSEKKEGKNPLK